MIQQILKRLKITNPDFDALRRIEILISKALLKAANDAKKEERKRCYKFAMYCRKKFLKHKKDLPQDIVVATEVVAEGIQKGRQAGGK